MRSNLRSALLLVIGLAIGAVATNTIGNALRRRDAYPRAVMVIMAHHMGMLQGELRGKQCPADANTRQLQRVATLADEIVPAFTVSDGSVLPPFRKAAKHLQDALATGVSSAPADCAQLAATMHHIGQNCDDCHRRFR